MTKPKIKPMTKSKTYCRSDRHDPKNMNTKQLYLMALDYKDIDENCSFISEPKPFTFSDIPKTNSLINTNCNNDYKPHDNNITNLLYSNLGISEENTFSLYDSTKFYEELTTIYCKKLPIYEIQKSSINKCINKNIIKDYLVNIKKKDSFYSL